MVDSTLRLLRSPYVLSPTLEEALMSVVPREYLVDDFSLREWLADEDADNWLYYDPATRRDFAMFERVNFAAEYEGHQWFGTHKGRAGIDFGRRVLADFFDRNDRALILGHTPVENRPAIWMAKKLGFQSRAGLGSGYVVFSLTADRFRGIMSE